ncbi:MAG: ATP-dependent DNA helicase RecG, partial [Rhodocyclaceae bacterium]|nr:ATP-dependent DNA helicase RecG [Rhodocyclaceae bacterium]
MTDPAAETSLAASVSPALAARLSRLGLTRNIDFLLHLPLRYEDETRLTPIAEAQIGQTVQVEGEIIHSEIVHRKRRQLIAQLRDDTGTLHARWLNFYPSLPPRLAPGARFRFFGEIRAGFSGIEMVHPRLSTVRAEEAPLPACLTPVYPTTAGLAQSALRKLILAALRLPPPPEL